MTSIKTPMKGFKSFFAELESGVKAWVSRQIEVRLEGEVEGWVYRRSYERRVGTQQTNHQCQRCGTKQVRHFSRNGHRERQLVTGSGVLTIRLPRVVCDCGGAWRGRSRSWRRTNGCGKMVWSKSDGGRRWG